MLAPLTVVGNPGNRRLTLFCAAARQAGLPRPHVVSWRDVAAGAVFRIEPGSWVRIESPGEDAEVDRLLRTAASVAEPGEIVGLAAWYQGFAAALDRIATTARSVGAVLLNDPAEILTMFDKRRCHARLAAAGIPVPPALGEISGYASLRARMRTAGWSRVFVKPAHGSSASGVLALRVAPGRVHVTTTVELVPAAGGPRLFNSLRPRDYTDETAVASIVDCLAADGVHVERWYPKAGLSGRVVDLRVVVIGGRPSHLVVRAGRTPMTNLHAGGVRGDVGQLRAAAGEESFTAAMRTCVEVARCFPACLHVGVDLMFASSWRTHAVAEVNAFGDLLPGLLADGRDTYAAQLDALSRLARLDSAHARSWPDLVSADA